MAGEPGVVDANVLVYALDVSAAQHAASRALLEAARARETTLYVTLQILCEFYSVVTNARRVSKPRLAAEVLGTVASLLNFLEVLPVPANIVGVWLELLRLHPVTGPDVFDLQIIATMRANGVRRIYTFNVDDFKGYSELVAVTP
jgi:predicted nucleic acid-binding protein